VQPKDFIESPERRGVGRFPGMLRSAQHDSPSYVTNFWDSTLVLLCYKSLIAAEPQKGQPMSCRSR